MFLLFIAKLIIFIRSCRTLSKITLELEDMSTRRAISRFLHRASISSQLDECIWEVDDALQSFNVSCMYMAKRWDQFVTIESIPDRHIAKDERTSYV